MKKILFTTVLLLSCVAILQAQTKRALFIGINTYFPAGASASPERTPPPNLNGCVNDATAVKELMQTRYGFAEKNIATLFNQDASRANIIKQIEKLISESKKGDVVFIYYAGHGSQVNNSLSKENDKKDETIVPADAYKGVFDIRDKELAILFNKLVDKGVILTSIFDSCHSGSISRGKEPPVLRFSPGDTRDVKDPSDPTPPENNGALTISAARDIEPAKEIRDENDLPHGGFTTALLQVLRTEQVGAPVQQIFNRIEAIMQFMNLEQKPVLAGNEERRKGTLLGIDKSLLPDKMQIPVIKVEDGMVRLQAGFPSAISEKTQLERKTDAGIIKLEITQMGGPNVCIAKVTEGDINAIKSGDLFEVTNIVYPPKAALKVYIYQSGFSIPVLTSTVKNMAAKNYQWQSPTGTVSAYQNLYFSDNKWVLTYKDRDFENIGKDIAGVDSKAVKDSTFFFNIPATENLGKLLNERFKGFTNVEITNDPNAADYHLVGRWKNGAIEYAFVNPLKIFGLYDINSPLPERTNFFTLGNDEKAEMAIVDSLENYILRIAKVKSWLTLDGPPDDGSYPFSFSLRRSNTGELIGNGGEVKYLDTLGLVFTVDMVNEAYWDRNKRYIYIFSIDQKGEMVLLFPQTITGENTYPVVDRNTFEIRQNAPIGPARIFRNTDSTGSSTYLMLTSATPINDLDIFRQKGVYDERKEGTRGGSPLEQLLKGVGASTRDQLIAPATWSITRISVKCVPRK